MGEPAARRGVACKEGGCLQGAAVDPGFGKKGFMRMCTVATTSPFYAHAHRCNEVAAAVLTASTCRETVQKGVSMETVETPLDLALGRVGGAAQQGGWVGLHSREGGWSCTAGRVCGAAQQGGWVGLHSREGVWAGFLPFPLPRWHPPLSMPSCPQIPSSTPTSSPYSIFLFADCARSLPWCKVLRMQT